MAENAQTIEELTAQNVQAVVKIEAAAHASRSTADCVADRITGFCGSMAFVWTHVAWFGGWIVANLLPGVRPFDPFPYSFLTLVVSLEAIFLSTFILISQNRQARIADRRNLLDLQIDLLAEQESTTALKYLREIARAVGAQMDERETQVLETPTSPDLLAEQIATTMDAVEAEHGVPQACDQGTPSRDRTPSTRD
jgi:uncharacterized membrane protein